MALRRQGTAPNFDPPEQQTHTGLPDRPQVVRPASEVGYNRDAVGGGSKAARALDPTYTLGGSAGELARATQARADEIAERARQQLDADHRDWNAHR